MERPGGGDEQELRACLDAYPVTARFLAATQATYRCSVDLLADMISSIASAAPDESTPHAVLDSAIAAGCATPVEAVHLYVWLVTIMMTSQASHWTLARSLEALGNQAGQHGRRGEGIAATWPHNQPAAVACRMDDARANCHGEREDGVLQKETEGDDDDDEDTQDAAALLCLLDRPGERQRYEAERTRRRHMSRHAPRWPTVVYEAAESAPPALLLRSELYTALRARLGIRDPAHTLLPRAVAVCLADFAAADARHGGVRDLLFGADAACMADAQRVLRALACVRLLHVRMLLGVAVYLCDDCLRGVKASPGLPHVHPVRLARHHRERNQKAHGVEPRPTQHDVHGHAPPSAADTGHARLAPWAEGPPLLASAATGNVQYADHGDNDDANGAALVVAAV